MTYGFTVYLEGVDALTDELANRIFDSGCDDCTPFSRAGETGVGFDRDAPTLEAAISSAVADLKAAGFVVSRVELDPADLAVAAGT